MNEHNNPYGNYPAMLESEKLMFTLCFDNEDKQLWYPLSLTLADASSIVLQVNSNFNYYNIRALVKSPIYDKDENIEMHLYLTENQINNINECASKTIEQLISFCMQSTSSETRQRIHIKHQDSSEIIHSKIQRTIGTRLQSQVFIPTGFFYDITNNFMEKIHYKEPVNRLMLYKFENNPTYVKYFIFDNNSDKLFSHTYLAAFLNRIKLIKNKDKRRFLFLYYHLCYMASLFSPVDRDLSLIIDTDQSIQNYLIAFLFGNIQNTECEIVDIQKDSEYDIIRAFITTKDLPFVMKINDAVAVHKFEHLMPKLFNSEKISNNLITFIPNALPVVFSTPANCGEDFFHLSIGWEDIEQPFMEMCSYFRCQDYFHELRDCFYYRNDSTDKEFYALGLVNFIKIKYQNEQKTAFNGETKIYAAFRTLNEILLNFYNIIRRKHPDQQFDYDFLFDEDIDTYLARFMQTLKLSSSFQKEQFYETVKKLVNTHTISVFQREKQDIEGCASRDEFESSACLLYSKTSWAFNDRAVELIAQSMPEPCSARRLLYLLNEKGVLTYRRINRDSYQNRLRVYFRDGEYTDAELYEVYPESGIIQTDESNYTLDSVKDGLYFHLGKNSTTGKEMYWDFDDGKNLNQHMLVTGQSGSGKSCFLQNLIPQAAQQGITTVVFHEQGSVPCEDQCEIIDVYEMQPGLSCFEYQSNDSHAVAERISAALRLTVNQKGIIDQAYEEYLQEKIPVSTGSEAPDGHCSVNDFIQTLITDRTSFSGVTPSVQRKLKCLSELSSSTDNVLDWSKYDGKVLVLDFRGNNGIPDWYKCYAELYLEDLFLYKQRCAQGNNPPTPMIIVSDEFQNMNMMKGAALDKILREGRKYGISLWLASQLVESDATSRLKFITDQSAIKVYFQAGTERSRKIANLLGKTASERAGLLSVIRSLEQREFVFQLNGKTPYKCIANEVKK